MAELHETLMGRKLIEHTLPEIARQLTRIADLLEEKNNNAEGVELVKAAKAYLKNCKIYEDEQRTNEE